MLLILFLNINIEKKKRKKETSECNVAFQAGRIDTILINFSTVEL